MGSESHVRDCGLWPGKPGKTGGSFSWVLLPRFAGFPKLRVLGLKLPLPMGSESHVRDCGLWPGRPGGTGGSFSWVLFPRFAGFSMLRVL